MDRRTFSRDEGHVQEKEPKGNFNTGPFAGYYVTLSGNSKFQVLRSIVPKQSFKQSYSLWIECYPMRQKMSKITSIRPT